MKTITVEDILECIIKQVGADGLCNTNSDHACGCLTYNLAPYNCLRADCELAKNNPKRAERERHVIQLEPMVQEVCKIKTDSPDRSLEGFLKETFSKEFLEEAELEYEKARKEGIAYEGAKSTEKGDQLMNSSDLRLYLQICGHKDHDTSILVTQTLHGDHSKAKKHVCGNPLKSYVYDTVFDVFLNRESAKNAAIKILKKIATDYKNTLNESAFFIPEGYSKLERKGEILLIYRLERVNNSILWAVNYVNPKAAQLYYEQPDKLFSFARPDSNRYTLVKENMLRVGYKDGILDTNPVLSHVMNTEHCAATVLSQAKAAIQGWGDVVEEYRSLGPSITKTLIKSKLSVNALLKGVEVTFKLQDGQRIVEINKDC